MLANLQEECSAYVKKSKYLTFSTILFAISVAIIGQVFFIKV